MKLKKFIKIILSILSVCLLIYVTTAVAALVYLYFQKEKIPKFTAEQVQHLTEAYVTNSAAAIFTSWDWNELQKRAHPELLKEIAAMSPETFKNQARILHDSLGNSKSNPVCALIQFASFTPTVRGAPGYIQANYHCKAEYQKGNAEMELLIWQENFTGPWKIRAFIVKTPDT